MNCLNSKFSEILKAELDQAKQIYDQEEQRIKGKIAFGRRSGGPPDLNHGNEARQCCPLEAGRYTIHMLMLIPCEERVKPFMLYESIQKLLFGSVIVLRRT